MSMELQELPKPGSGSAATAQEPTTSHVGTDQNHDQHRSNVSPPSAHLAPNPRSLSTWWTTHIALTLPDSAPHDPRDHLSLERTFLGWLRTTTVLVSLGVIVTQLFVLKDVDPTKGKVLGCVLAGAGMMIVLASAGRFFRAQALLERGKALTGGWEAVGVWVLIGVVLGTLFVVVLVEG